MSLVAEALPSNKTLDQPSQGQRRALSREVPTCLRKACSSPEVMLSAFPQNPCALSKLPVRGTEVFGSRGACPTSGPQIRPHRARGVP